jgi:hypothetical protein
MASSKYMSNTSVSAEKRCYPRSYSHFYLSIKSFSYAYCEQSQCRYRLYAGMMFGVSSFCLAPLNSTSHFHTPIYDFFYGF